MKITKGSFISIFRVNSNHNNSYELDELYVTTGLKKMFCLATFIAYAVIMHFNVGAGTWWDKPPLHIPP